MYKRIGCTRALGRLEARASGGRSRQLLPSHLCAPSPPPQAATFLVTAQRGARTVSLQVPSSFGVAGRYERLVALLGKEKWAVKSGGGLPAGGKPTWSGCMPRDVQAVELRFVRDELSPLRSRLSPIPEKVGRGRPARSPSRAGT